MDNYNDNFDYFNNDFTSLNNINNPINLLNPANPSNPLNWDTNPNNLSKISNYTNTNDIINNQYKFIFLKKHKILSLIIWCIWIVFLFTLHFYILK